MTDAAVQRAIDHADLARDAADDAKEIAVRAEAKIDSHDRVCSERYSRILQNQEAADTARNAIIARLDKIEESVASGFKEIRGALTKAVFLFVGAVVTLGTAYLIHKFGWR